MWSGVSCLFEVCGTVFHAFLKYLLRVDGWWATEMDMSGHGERDRAHRYSSKLAAPGNMLFLTDNALAVNDLAVNGALPCRYLVKKCLRYSP